MDKTIQATKRIYFVLIALSVALFAVLLFAPWVTATYLTELNETVLVPYQTNFTLFQLGKLVSEIERAMGSTKAIEAVIPSIRMFTIWPIVSIVLLLVYLAAVITNRRWSVWALAAAFINVMMLAFFFMNLVYDANGVSTVVGSGIFTKFMSITHACWGVLVLAPICLSFFVTAVIKYFSGRAVEVDASKITSAEKRRMAKASSQAGGLRLLLSNILRDRNLYLMLVPFLAYYVIFYYLPYGGLKIAFLDYKILKGLDGSNWVGFDNFVKFFTGPNFWNTLRNTLNLSISSLLIGFPIPIILALLFNEVRNKFFRTMTQTIAYIPNFISTMVIAGLIVNFLSPSAGIVNVFLGWFGIEPIYFLVKPEYFKAIYIIQGIWSGAGFGSIIYYSSLCSIDAELYEAATIDGAGRLMQTWYISLPGLAGTISIMLIMAVGGILGSNTDLIILLYQPATYSVADVIGTYVYRIGLTGQTPNYSMSTAVGLFNGIVGFFFVISANKISKLVGGSNLF